MFTGHGELRAALQELVDQGVKFPLVQDEPSLANNDLVITSRRVPNGDVPVERGPPA